MAPRASAERRLLGGYPVRRPRRDPHGLGDVPFDFVGSISRELPIRFLCSIFRVSQADAPQLISWGDKMIANQDHELSAAVIDKVDTEEFRLLPFRSPVARDVFAYADAQADQRREEPSEYVIQALVT